MSSDSGKLDAIRNLATTDPVLFRKQVQKILDEDRLVFSPARFIRVTVETSDFQTRTVQKFVVEQARVSQADSRDMIYIEGEVSNVEKRVGE